VGESVGRPADHNRGSPKGAAVFGVVSVDLAAAGMPARARPAENGPNPLYHKLSRSRGWNPNDLKGRFLDFQQIAAP
jgi:hypothetical protein